MKEQYLTSFYFTITTMTTVGYGDLSASTFLEKIVCILIMFIGVITFSFASGALANYIDKTDEQNEKFASKMNMLDELYREHLFPLKLYADIRKNIQQNYKMDAEGINDFVDDLPLDFKQKIAIYIYKDMVEEVKYLKGKK